MSTREMHLEAHVGYQTGLKELDATGVDLERRAASRALSVADMLEILQGVEDKSQPMTIEFYRERPGVLGLTCETAYVFSADETVLDPEGANVRSVAVTAATPELLDTVLNELGLDCAM